MEREFPTRDTRVGFPFLFGVVRSFRFPRSTRLRSNLADSCVLPSAAVTQLRMELTYVIWARDKLYSHSAGLADTLDSARCFQLFRNFVRELLVLRSSKMRIKHGVNTCVNELHFYRPNSFIFIGLVFRCEHFFQHFLSYISNRRFAPEHIILID